MAQELSKNQEALTSKTNIGMMLILEIDGFTEYFGSDKVKKYWKIGDKGVYIGRPDLYIGGTIDDEKALPLIDLLKGETTKTISQQLELDRGGSGSIQTMKISLVDQGGQVTKMMSPGFHVDDVLGREATVYLAFYGGSHPEDSFRLFQGVVDTVRFAQSSVTVTISHPSKLEDKTLFVQKQTRLTSAISDVDTWIPVESLSGFHAPVNKQGVELESYIKIDDEYIKYTSKFESGSIIEFRGCTRGMFGTIPQAYDSETDIESFYYLKGDAVNLPLALLLSDGGQNIDPMISGVKASSIVNVSAVNKVNNAIFFQGINLKEYYGLVEGDYVALSGALNFANNFGDELPIPQRQITSFGSNSTGHYVVLDGPALAPEISSDLLVSFYSQFNVLPEGCGLSSKMVDIQQFLDTKKLIGTSIFNYEFPISEDITAKDFINLEIFMPSGLYQVPRKGRVSVDSTLPAIAGRDSKTLDDTNIIEAESLVIERSVNKNFYNAILWKYDFDPVDEKYKRSELIIDTTSRIKDNYGDKPLIIECKGLRRSDENTSKIKRQTAYLLNRYKNAAEAIEVTTNLKTGFNIDISDITTLNGKTLKLADSRTGNRDFVPRKMQVINKTFSFSSQIKLTLLDTTFRNDARYGQIAPASLIMTGSQSDKLYLKGFYFDENDSENKKWSSLFIGQRLLVRSYDWTIQEETKIISFDEANTRCAYIETLSFTPSEGMILEIPNYDNTSKKEMQIAKDRYCFLNPSLKVVSGISENEIEVSSQDAARLKAGSPIDIHNEDYTVSLETQVLSIDSNNITLKDSLEVIPDSTYTLDLVGFLDDGAPYRIL